MTIKSTAKEVLVEAKQKITEIGWCKGQYVKWMVAPAGNSYPVAYCLEGAVRSVLSYHVSETAALNMLKSIIPPSTNFSDHPLTQFNDRAETQLHDVVRVLDEAIAKAPEVKS